MAANIRDPEATKLRIIKEAEKQFAEKGLEAASVNVIADNAEINKRMIYHYYGSKEELYKEVLRVNFQRIKAIGEKNLNNQDDLLASVKQIISDYYYFLRDNHSYVHIMAREELSGGKYVREVMLNTLLLDYDKLSKVYDEGVLKGLFKKDIDLKQLIISINALCFMTFARKEMFKVLWKENIEEKLEERLEHIYNLVLNGICLKPV